MRQHLWVTQGERVCRKDTQQVRKSVNGYPILCCRVLAAHRLTTTMIERVENPWLFSSGQQSGDPLVGRSSVSFATL
jgi:hypothetical protein